MIPVVNFVFNECKAGERLKDSICEPCPAGEFSFEAGSIKCSQCIPKATCPGGKSLSLQEGFWRSN